jgi:hypothetical protein
MPGSTPHHLGESNMSKNNSAVATASKSATVETTHSQPLNGRENVEAILLEAMKLSDGPGEPLVRNERMYESIRQNEYDLNSALAELPDNSVEAGAKNIWIVSTTEDRTYGKKKVAVLSELAVIDDGWGMDATAQNKSLVLGDSARKPRPDGKRGIGKFGVGLVTGSLSIARRIEVYTRDRKDGSFTYTFIDLDLIGKRLQTTVPTPIEKEPPAKYKEHLKEHTGTIVVLSQCDRLQYDTIKERAIPASEQLAGLPGFMGRTYRKFIANGVNFWFNGNPVYLHDPLYLLGPTRFDLENAAKGQDPDLKAKNLGAMKLELDIPGKPGEKADVTITVSLLPEEWRTHAGAGGSAFAKERRIDENEGISILRADREVLYGQVPYIIGKRGIAKFDELDRFWGCEISFPPELDEYFHIRYIKRGAEPVPSLRDKIREKLATVVAQQRKEISDRFKKTASEKAEKAGHFRDAANIMAEADTSQPKGHRGQDVPPEQVDETLRSIVEESADGEDKTKDQKKRELESQPYSIVPVSYPQSIFFEPVYLPDRILIKLNINHPFYTEIIAPLCGSVEAMNEDSDVDLGTSSPEQRKVRRAIMLLLLSHAKAESFFDGNKEIDENIKTQGEVLDNLRSQWGLALGAATRKLAEKE